MLAPKYQQLYRQLKNSIPEDRLIHDDLRLLAFGTDASFYRLIPKLVVKVHNESEAIAVIKNCNQLHIPLTVRAAGTSLSGQAVSDSVLMLMVGSKWRKYSINQDATEITVQPGLTGGKINTLLAKHQKRLGPDPASIHHASIGGIIANNAAGMSSGIKDNSFHTISGMRIVFNDGIVLDTRDEQSRQTFLEQKKEFVNKVQELAKRIKKSKKLAQKIEEKYSIKNTTGYSVNALLYSDDPIDMIMRLMVGSEGTLGFISEISLKTLDDPPKKATALVFFPDIATACETIALLKKCSVAAAELMDRASLRAVEDKPEMPSFLKKLDENVTALLVETRAFDDKLLDKQIKEIKKALKDVPLARKVEFTKNPKEIDGLWAVREGLFTSVSAAREKGTTVIIEDIGVPYKNLAKALIGLQELFVKHEYHNAIIWGHAFDGNVHFVITQDFSKDAELRRYENIINDLVEMIVDKYDGSLKCEHGTGRNMAPFVEREWGSAIYGMMKEIKQIFDAENILNPGVLINDDPKLHLKNLKPLPQAHDLIDACIECGFCENNCVSHELTLSARQRIVVYREIKKLERTGEEPHHLAQLRDKFDYYGNQTCATDGLCALSCPVDIDTGLLIKELRADELSDRAKKIAAWLAQNMDRVTASMRFALDIVHFVHRLIGSKAMLSISSVSRKISGNRLPLWTPSMPKGSSAVTPHKIDESNPLKVVYFSTCINRAMGVSQDYDEKAALTQKTESLLRKAGYEIIYPANINQLCCGMAYSSKGFKEAAAGKSKELDEALLLASNNGEYPVLVDMSPCLYHMKETLSEQLHLFDPIEFTLKYLAPRLEFKPTDEAVTIFSVCSSKKMGLEDAFLELAQKCSRNVIVNESACCGFAGDRGFTYPELNAHGLADIKEQIPEGVKRGFSTSRTCEIGLTQHSGISYKSILYLVDECTKAK